MTVPATHRRFVWQIELPVVLALILLVAVVVWYTDQGEHRQQRAADTRAAAISAARAVKRAAAKANGSYAGLNGKSATALDRYGYQGSTRVAIAITTTAGSYCVVATDAGLSGSQWRQVSIHSGARSLQPGAHC